MRNLIDPKNDYMFLDIFDALPAINQRVDLIGIVVDVRHPKPTKGTDWTCSLKIISESRPKLGIYVLFFGETIDRLPFVECLGDVIMVSRVTMKTRGTEIYAMYDKKVSSFAIFEGRDYGEDKFVPYQKSPKFSATHQGTILLNSFRTWLLCNKPAGLNYFLSLKDIRRGDNFNLLCKILHMCKINENQWILFFWDGTDTPPAFIQANLEDEIDNPLPLQLEFPLSRSNMCAFPSVGSVLRMIIDEDKRKIIPDTVLTNRWAKFVNIECEVHCGLWLAVVMASSKIFLLSDDDDRVQERERTYNERVVSKMGRIPLTSFPWPSDITETDHSDTPFVTLMNVLTYPAVTSKFHCVVRVIAVFPWRVDDFRSPCGTYRVRLTLEDPTARIHAYLYAEDGVKFFGNDTSNNILERKRNMLLGIDDETSWDSWMNIWIKPPWIQCCLKSYYLDKKDAWGSRSYRVFGTTVKC